MKLDSKKELNRAEKNLFFETNNNKKEKIILFLKRIKGEKVKVSLIGGLDETNL